MFDAQSPLALVKEVAGRIKAKRFFTRLTFVRYNPQDVTPGMKLDFVATTDNETDLFTRGLGSTTTEKLLR